MNPGHHEALKNEPFVGPSGRLLKRLLSPLPPVPTYLTNACRCSTPSFDPVDLNYRACAPYLLEDIHAIFSHHQDPVQPPPPLLPMGNADGVVDQPPPPSQPLLVLLALGSAAVGQIHRLASLKRPSVTAALSRQGTTLLLPPVGSLLHPGTRGLPPSPAPLPVVLFSTFHPAFLLREPSSIPAAEDHFRLLSDFLSGILPTPSSPSMTPPRPPRTP